MLCKIMTMYVDSLVIHGITLIKVDSSLKKISTS